MPLDDDPVDVEVEVEVDVEVDVVEVEVDVVPLVVPLPPPPEAALDVVPLEVVRAGGSGCGLNVQATTHVPITTQNGRMTESFLIMRKARRLATRTPRGTP
jgi:hypothetical protein